MSWNNVKQQKIKLSQDPESQLYVDGFSGGLNTLTSPQHIQDNECSILLNAEISEDGVINRRTGTAFYDSATDGSRVFGLKTFTTYNSSGVPTRTLLKMDEAGHLKKLNTGNGTWSTITGHTYATGLNTEFVQSQTNCYILNGSDPLSRTDGSTITTFTQVTNPTGGLTVAATGTTGATAYGYVYTLVTTYGETTPCATVSITNGNATLTTSNYNLLTITRSTDANVTGYNVYGRKANLLFFLKFVPQTTSGNPTYTDTGADTPTTAWGAPVSNTTEGKVCSMGTVYHDSLLLAGDPAFTSRLYYSAGLEDFEDFSLVNGGGFQDVQPEDGDVISAVLTFKDKIIVFKNRSSYLFEFNGTQPVLTVINPLIGCAAPRTAQVVLNDIFFMSPTGGVFTLGYQQGYYGAGGVADLLRTNEVSIKISPTIQGINPVRISQATAIYYPAKYKYLLAYPDGSSTTNSKIVAFDTRYGSWVQWDNISANCIATYIDSSNSQHLLYGDDTQGRIVEFFNGSSDRGGAFTFRMRTKDFTAGAFHLTKTWVWPTFHFRNVFGSVQTTIINDGANTVYTNTVTSTTSYTGWSFDEWGKFDWATTTGTSATAASADQPRQVSSRYDSRSIMFLFENTSASDSFTLLGVESRYITRVGRRLSSQYILN